MGILELLTIVFIVLKLIGTIDWSWWLVLLPTIVSFSFYLLWMLVFGTFFAKTTRKINKHFDDDDDDFFNRF